MNRAYLRRARHSYNTHRMFVIRAAKEGGADYSNYAELWEQRMFFWLLLAAEQGEL